MISPLAADALAGRAALVTGGARGIGAAIVAALRAAGAEVALTSRDLATAEAAARQAGALGLACEITSADSVAAAVAASRRALGRLDILVNNAGVAARPAPIEDTSEAEWDRVLATDLKGPFLACRAVVPGMKAAGWGRIVNIGSTATRQTVGRVLPYVAAKGGLAALTRMLALELAPSGITANCVHPGPTRTEMWDANVTPEQKARTVANIPLGRIGEAEEIAALVAYLCTPAAGFVTAENLYAGGGWPGRVPG
jgi:NAD(P)-dependent dehydrogenase (short-subunit alcohol dehydrogenase family)